MRNVIACHRLITAIVLWLLVIVVFYGVIVLLAAPVVDWIGKAPDIGRNIQEKLRVLDRPLSVLQELRDAFLPSDKKGSLGVDIMSIPAAGGSHRHAGDRPDFSFSSAHCFSCCSVARRLRRVLVAFFDERDARLRMLKIMNDIEHNLTGYLSIVTIINVAIGLCGGFAAWVDRPAGSGCLGCARLHPQFHSIHRCADDGGCICFWSAS